MFVILSIKWVCLFYLAGGRRSCLSADLMHWPLEAFKSAVLPVQVWLNVYNKPIHFGPI